MSSYLSFISADMDYSVLICLCAYKRQYKLCFKNTSECFHLVMLSSHCHHTVIVVVHKWRPVPGIAIMTAVSAVVFRKHKKRNTDTQKFSGMDKSCRGLSFIVTKPPKARGVRHVPNVHTTVGCV